MATRQAIQELANALLDMSSAARKARAPEQGFDTDTTWYHGANRLDRLLEKDSLNPRRATSGPMPFLTDSPELASSYAKGKADTSMADVDTNYDNWFKVRAGSGKPKRVSDAWHYLDPEEKAEIMEKLPKVAQDDMAENIVMGDGLTSRDHWEYTLRQNRGNPIAAARELWLDGGTLYGEEEKFADVLRMGGLKRKIEWDSPHMELPGVLPVYARVSNPLNTDNADELKAVYERLKSASKGKRYKNVRDGGADQWDKRNIGIREFTDRLGSDLETGDTMAWTSIPDVVTDELRAMGYDGILDTGGKGGGTPHRVLIPFEPNQVRSVNAAFDPAKTDSPNLLAGGAAAAVGLGAATQGEDASAMPVSAEPTESDIMRLVNALGKGAGFVFDSLELPTRGLHGLANTTGRLIQGQGLDQALQGGANVARQSIPETAQQLGTYTADKTGNPYLAALVDAITNVTALEP